MCLIIAEASKQTLVNDVFDHVWKFFCFNVCVEMYGKHTICGNVAAARSSDRNNTCIEYLKSLTLRPPSTTVVSYANSLDPVETASNSPSHPDPSCLTLRQHFHQL